MTSKGSHRSQYSLVLGLSSLNNTFDKKSIILPFYPDFLRLGRQTNAKTQPAPDNGYFDSRVLSRAHAEVWADYDTGRVWIKDSKSSNGTYVNSLRLGDEKSESEPHELRKNDIVELGIDIANDEGTSFVHRKICAKVDRISFMSLQARTPQLQLQGPQTQQLQLHPGQMNKQPDQYTQNGYAGDNTMNGTMSRNNRGQANGGAMRPTRYFTESLDMALFGDMDASLEELSLSHSRSSVSGLFMNSGVASSAAMELIVKKLVAEIHATKVEYAKIQSVSKLLEEIGANQQESRLLSEKLPALDEFKHQIASLETQLEAAKTEISEKNRHIYELERELAKANAEPEPRPTSPDAINRHGDPVSPPVPVPAPADLEQREGLEPEGEPEAEKAHEREAQDVRLLEPEAQDGSVLEQKEEQPAENERSLKPELEPETDIIPTPEDLTDTPKTADVEKLHLVLAELEELKRDLAVYERRAKAAESLALQQSKQIAELLTASSDINPTSGVEHSATTTTRGSNGNIILLPIATAIGVVIVGAGFMAMLNSIASESVK